MLELLLDIASMVLLVIGVACVVGFLAGIAVVVYVRLTPDASYDFDERMAREVEDDIHGEASMYRREPPRKREPEPRGA